MNRQDKPEEPLTAKEYLSERPVNQSIDPPHLNTIDPIVERDTRCVLWRGEAEYKFGGYNTKGN